MEQAKIEMLVIEMQMGSRSAFDQLCRFYHSGLLRFSYKICHNPHMAHDAVQNSWLKLTKSIKKLNDPRAFKAWLYQLVRWQTLDLLRKANRDFLDFDEVEIESADEFQSSNEPVQTSNILGSELSQAIAQLSAIDQQAIYLFYLEDMTINEISKVLDIAQGTIKSRLNRARNALRATLGEQKNEY